jgi:carbamoyl-phosphate synthase large subunit
MSATPRKDGALRVAVTALNATDNPAPGVAVIRALRLRKDSCERIVGLTYDALDSGIYSHDLADAAYLLPYPSQGLEAFRDRLLEIHSRERLDVIVPTVDAELPSFLELEPELREVGIGMFLPTKEAFELRSKVHLLDLAERAGVDTPKAAVISDVAELAKVHERVPYPFYVKGVFYGAHLARSLDEAIIGFHKSVAQWGLPAIVQEQVDGEEFDVVAVGDGKGGLVGAVPMKKTLLTDKGKGWAGIAVKDPDLIRVTEAFMHASSWRGPCEVEVIRDKEGVYHLLEINPRFPAWCYMSAGAGMNLPLAVVQLAAGRTPDPLGAFEPGTMFVRIALDQIAKVSDFEAIATTGELVRTREGGQR